MFAIKPAAPGCLWPFSFHSKNRQPWGLIDGVNGNLIFELRLATFTLSGRVAVSPFLPKASVRLKVMIRSFPRPVGLGSMVAIFFLAWCSCSSDAWAEEMRTWSDASGKFKIQGKFASEEDGKITLEKPDGSEMEIELKKLSSADQKYVKGLKKKGNETPAEIPGGMGAAVTSKIGTAKTVEIKMPSKPWKFEVPKELPTVKNERSLTSIPPRSDFFEGMKGFVGSRSGKFGGIGYIWDRAWQKKGDDLTRLVICDLEEEKQISNAAVKGRYIPLAIDDTGQRLALKRDEDGKKDRLEFWTIEGDVATKGVEWIPYNEAKGGDREIAWAAFVGDDRILTVGNGGHLVMWKVEGLRPLYKVQISGRNPPAMTADQKWLAFTTGKELCILDLKLGAVVGMQKTPQMGWSHLAFSPGQRRLAMDMGDRLFVWDFATGEKYREISYLGQPLSGPVAFADEDHVLLGKKYLIQINDELRLWEFSGGDYGAQVGGLIYFTVPGSEKSSGSLIGMKLPLTSQKEFLATAMNDPKFLALAPNSSVKLDVSAVDPAGREIAQKGLTERLKEYGFSVSPDAPVSLVAETALGKEEEVEYQGFGFGPISKVKAKDFQCGVKFVFEGKTLWTNSIGTRPPHMISLQNNETIEQYVNKTQKYNFDWFAKVVLPQRLPKGTVGNSFCLGVTQMTATGAF